MPAPIELGYFADRLDQAGIPYMITGATAAILYGQPRVTNDVDVVISLNDAGRAALLAAFASTDFYVPPESVIQMEQARSQRGHFNLIHLESGIKADIYLAGSDPLHAWAMPLRRQIKWSDGKEISLAPPEYVVLRKLEYFREGGSSKHLSDIRAIRDVTGLDERLMAPWIARLGLAAAWTEVSSSK